MYHYNTYNEYYDAIKIPNNTHHDMCMLLMKDKRGASIDWWICKKYIKLATLFEYNTYSSYLAMH